eukprot:9332709-Karenia_brevis.AAC.1
MAGGSSNKRAGCITSKRRRGRHWDAWRRLSCRSTGEVTFADQPISIWGQLQPISRSADWVSISRSADQPNRAADRRS